MDGDVADVVESPEGAFDEEDTLGQAIKREPLMSVRCVCPARGFRKKGQFYHIGNHRNEIIL